MYFGVNVGRGHVKVVGLSSYQVLGFPIICSNIQGIRH